VHLSIFRPSGTGWKSGLFFVYVDIKVDGSYVNFDIIF
jgi:hypothetical protein